VHGITKLHPEKAQSNDFNNFWKIEYFKNLVSKDDEFIELTSKM